MNAAIWTHKSNKSDVPQPERQKKKKIITPNFTWACFSDKIFTDINRRGHLYIF